MKEQKVTGMLIDVTNNSVKIVAVPDELTEYYRILNCEYIDIYRRKIGDRWYSVICDDEGALKEGAIVSAMDVQGRIAFFGNLFILSGRNDDAELHSLTDSEIANLYPNVATKVLDKAGNMTSKAMVFNVDYR